MTPKDAAVYNVKALNQALLVAGEKQLRLLNKDGKVHGLNIETQQVVQTWDTARDEVNLPQVDGGIYLLHGLLTAAPGCGTMAKLP